MLTCFCFFGMLLTSIQVQFKSNKRNIYYSNSSNLSQCTLASVPLMHRTEVGRPEARHENLLNRKTELRFCKASLTRCDFSLVSNDAIFKHVQNHSVPQHRIVVSDNSIVLRKQEVDKDLKKEWRYLWYLYSFKAQFW